MDYIQLSLFGKMSQALFHQTIDTILKPCSKRSQKPAFQCLNLDGPEPEWYEGDQLILHGGHLMPSIGEFLSVAAASTLSEILEDDAPERYSLSRRACWGILRRAMKRKQKLPEMLEEALIWRIQK